MAMIRHKKEGITTPSFSLWSLNLRGMRGICGLIIAYLLGTMQHTMIIGTIQQEDADFVWKIQPLEQSTVIEFAPGQKTDSYNPIYNYLMLFNREKSNKVDFPELPMWHTWIHFPEAYHNHFNRFRKRNKVIFMEVGVQSGGKIPMLRDYFGPGLVYIGIDIDLATKMFESTKHGVHIEIGDSGNATFWQYMMEKYPHVDIFLDDGGHTMEQQKITIELMLPHIQHDGVYICEDLSTSWGLKFGGIPNKDHHHKDFREKTMVGLVHKTLDWLTYGFIPGGVMKYKSLPTDFYNESWWRIIPDQVKHIHYYNQIVVYEKGLTYVPANIRTVGLKNNGTKTNNFTPFDWDLVMKKIQKYTGSKWEW